MPLKRVNTELRTLLHSFFCPSHTPTRGQLHLQNKHKRLRTNFNTLRALSVGHHIHHCGQKEAKRSLLGQDRAWWRAVVRSSSLLGTCFQNLPLAPPCTHTCPKTTFFRFYLTAEPLFGFLRVTGHWTGTVHSSHLVVKSGAFEARNAGPVRIPSSSYQQSSSNSSRG